LHSAGTDTCAASRPCQPVMHEHVSSCIGVPNHQIGGIRVKRNVSTVGGDRGTSAVAVALSATRIQAGSRSDTRLDVTNKHICFAVCITLDKIARFGEKCHVPSTVTNERTPSSTVTWLTDNVPTHESSCSRDSIMDKDLHPTTGHSVKSASGFKCDVSTITTYRCVQTISVGGGRKLHRYGGRNLHTPASWRLRDSSGSRRCTGGSNECCYVTTWSGA
jgi:hypothetical protein